MEALLSQIGASRTWITYFSSATHFHGSSQHMNSYRWRDKKFKENFKDKKEKSEQREKLRFFKYVFIKISMWKHHTQVENSGRTPHPPWIALSRHVEPISWKMAFGNYFHNVLMWLFPSVLLIQWVVSHIFIYWISIILSNFFFLVNVGMLKK